MLSPLRMVTRAAWAAVLALLLIAAGCTPGDASDKPPDNATGNLIWKGRTVHIAMVAPSGTEVRDLSAKLGAENACHDIGIQLGVSVVVDWHPPTGPSAKAQREAIEASLAAAPSGLLVSAVEGDDVAPAIDAAVAKGIPVMTYDFDAPKSKRLAFYGIDDVGLGQRLAREALPLVSAKGSWALLAGPDSDSVSQRRVEGVLKEGAKMPEKHLAGTFHCETDPASATKAVLKAQAEHPEIQVWVMVGPWAMLDGRLMVALPSGKVKIVGADCLPPEFPYLDKGPAVVMLSVPTYQQAYKAAQRILHKIVANEEVHVAERIDPNRIGQRDLHTWALQLQRWGYKDIDPQYLVPKPRSITSN